jgi:hypothetical protein
MIRTKLIMAALATFALIIAAPLRADFLVTMDTTPLETIGGTWILDFQLIQGQTLSNSVTVSDITLGGGSNVPGSDTFSDPSATGGFPDYSLTDNGFISEATVEFTAGSQVQFDLAYTNNFDGTDLFDGANPVADTFTWAVEQVDPSALFPPSIVSADLGAGLVVLLDGTTNITTVAADDAFGDITPNVTPIVPVGTVPEPTQSWLVVAGLLLSAVAYRRVRFRGSPDASRSSI